MSSDREILCCLKILREVERYVCDNKRDAAEVAEKLQHIIDEREPQPPLVSDERSIVLRLKEKINYHELNWKYSICMTAAEQRIRAEIVPGRYYEIYKQHFYTEHWRHIGLRLYDNSHWCEIGLNNEDKKFFDSLLCLIRDGKREEIIEKFQTPKFHQI